MNYKKFEGTGTLDLTYIYAYNKDLDKYLTYRRACLDGTDLIDLIKYKAVFETGGGRYAKNIPQNLFDSESQWIVSKCTTDEMNAITKGIFPSSSTNPVGAVRYFGQFTVNTKTILVISIDPGYSVIHVNDTTGIRALEVVLEDLEVSQTTILFFILDSDGSISEVNLSLEAFYNSREAFRNKKNYSLINYQYKETLLTPENWITESLTDPRNGVILGLKKLQQIPPLASAIRGRAVGFQRRRVYGDGEAVYDSGNKWISCIPGNLGENPVISPYWSTSKFLDTPVIEPGRVVIDLGTGVSLSSNGMSIESGSYLCSYGTKMSISIYINNFMKLTGIKSNKVGGISVDTTGLDPDGNGIAELTILQEKVTVYFETATKVGGIKLYALLSGDSTQKVLSHYSVTTYRISGGAKQTLGNDGMITCEMGDKVQVEITPNDGYTILESYENFTVEITESSGDLGIPITPKTWTVTPRIDGNIDVFPERRSTVQHLGSVAYKIYPSDGKVPSIIPESGGTISTSQDPEDLGVMIITINNITTDLTLIIEDEN